MHLQYVLTTAYARRVQNLPSVELLLVHTLNSCVGLHPRAVGYESKPTRTTCVEIPHHNALHSFFVTASEVN